MLGASIYANLDEELKTTVNQIFAEIAHQSSGGAA